MDYAQGLKISIDRQEFMAFGEYRYGGFKKAASFYRLRKFISQSMGKLKVVFYEISELTFTDALSVFSNGINKLFLSMLNRFLWASMNLRFMKALENQQNSKQMHDSGLTCGILYER